MTKCFWIQVALISFFVVLMVASTGGRRIRGGSWRFGGSRSSSHRGSIRSNANRRYTGSTRSKTHMKYVAGAAIAGGVGGFKLRNAVSNMGYHFGNDMDSRYYNSYQNLMPSQVYRPMYQDNSHVSEDRFVTGCYNMSMNKYAIKPNDGKNIFDIGQTEVRVRSAVIRQLCVSEYRRGPDYYKDSGMNLLFSPSLILFIMLVVYIVVE